MIISPVGFWSRRWLLSCVALVFLLLAAGSAQATITVLNYWHLGESDPGAVSGGQCLTTLDAVGGHTLTNLPTAGPYAIYTNGVSLAVSAETASVLAVAFTNNEYLAGNVATAAVDNFGIECWVNTGTNAGAHMVVNNGLRSNGWGLYQSGTTYEAIYGGRIFFGSVNAPMNTWMHLALVRNNGVAILYTNGVPASTNSVTAPIMPSGSFTVGGDANLGEYFVGGIDEVRVFTFASGAFSTNDLLLNATHLLVVNTNDAGPGSLRNAIAYAPSGATVNFTNTLSGQTILLTSASITLNQNVTIDASALADGIQLNGNGHLTVLVAHAGTVLLNALTITNGNDIGGQSAGGIYNQTALTVTNCTIAGNLDANGGGGLFNAPAAVLTLNNCTLVNNDGGVGSGGGLANSGTLTLNNCTVAYNHADNNLQSGGGIYNQGMLTVNNCTVAYNDADHDGGGIFNNGGTLNLTNSIVCSNTAPSDPDVGGLYAGAGNLVGLAAQLAPLGYYGGLTEILPPYAGSPAIDAGSDAVTSFLTTDQRGHPRQSGAHVDIGAVEVDTNSIVTLSTDTGAAGTLRYAVAHTQANDLINFATTLSGATILLSGSAITLNQGVTIDGSTLMNGIQINGNASSPVLVVHTGTVLLNSLTITNGYDASGAEAGGIANYSRLTLDNCTIAGSVDLNGAGGFYNSATLTLNSCTVANNIGGSGHGGGIYNDDLLTVNNSTLAGNSSSNGGGIYNGAGTVYLTNTIVCSNTAASNPDMSGTYSGADNLVGLNALLAPLGYYGGLTETMPPYAGSPAIDAGSDAVTSFLTTDQRGHARTSGAHVDIGAVEVDTNSIVTLSTDNGAAGTLRYAVTHTQTNDLISFAQNLSGATLRLSGSVITLNHGVTIDGSALANGIQIDGNANSPVLVVRRGVVLLNSLTIANGHDTSGIYAGGVANFTTLTLNNCTIAGNLDSVGAGGIYNFSGAALTLNNCTLANNDGGGGSGGGIYNAGTLTLNNSTLGYNHADNNLQLGGGIYNYLGTLTLNNCTVAYNDAAKGSGGIYNDLGTLNLTNSIVCSNTAASDPDIYGSYAGADNLIGLNARLAPLGNYGGPTPTMPPYVGSPAIDAGSDAVNSFFTTDQRGHPRQSGAHVDIGAVEVNINSIVTLKTGNGGAGTLRYAVTNALPGDLISFADTLSGGTILLPIVGITVSHNVTIDGSTLPTGVQINGAGVSRLFTISSGASVVLNTVTLTNGTSPINGGGAVLNNGTLTVNNCTLAGNLSSDLNVGGGAIRNQGTLNVNNSTFTQNRSFFAGGAIANANSMTLRVNNSTIVSNTATAGGGIYNNGGFLDVTNSIVAGNTPLGGDIVNSATFNQASNLYNTANAQVSPFGNYGGPTQTMPPKFGSPAIDGGTATIATTDQRGYPRLSGAHVDIGAVEVQFASAPFRLGSLSRLGDGTTQLSFTNLAGGNFTAYATTNLAQPFNTWSNLGPVTESPIGSGVFQFTDPEASKYPQRFYSVTSP